MQKQKSVVSPRSLAYSQIDCAAFDRANRLKPGAWWVDLPPGVSDANLVSVLGQRADSAGVKLIVVDTNTNRAAASVTSLVDGCLRAIERGEKRLALSPLVAAATLRSTRPAPPSAAPRSAFTAKGNAVFDLHEGILSLISAAAQLRPLLVVIRHAHDCDPDSSATIEHLIRAICNRNSFQRKLDVAVLALGDRSRTSRFAHRCRAAGASSISVPKLSRDDMIAWLAESSSADRLIELCGGVPERLETLLTQFPSLLVAMRNEMFEVSHDTSRIRELLQVAGAPLDAAELGKSLNLDEFTVRTHLSELLRWGLISEGHTGRFLAESPDERPHCPELHRSVASTFADRWTASGDEQSLLLATRHWLAAGDTEKAIRFGGRAGEILESRLAFFSARALYERLHECAPAAAPLVLALARVCVATGDNGEARRTLRRFIQLRKDGPFTSAHEQHEAVEAGRLLLATDAVGEAVSWLKRVVDEAEGAAPTVALAAACLRAGELNDCESLLRSTSENSVEKTRLWGNLQLARGRVDEAWVTYSEIADSAPDAVDRAMALHNLGLVALHRNRWAEAIRVLQKSLHVFEESGQYALAALCHSSLAVAYGQSERFARAETSARYAVEVFGRLDQPHGGAEALGILGELALVLADPSRAARLLQQSLKLAESVGAQETAAYASLLLARAALMRGRYGRSHTYLQAAKSVFDGQNRHELIAKSALVAAELAIRESCAADWEQAEEQFEALAIPPGHASLGPMALLRAEWAHGRGDCAAAVAHAREARDLFFDLGQRTGEVRALYGLEKWDPQSPEAATWRLRRSELVESLLTDCPMAQRKGFSSLAWMSLDGPEAAASGQAPEAAEHTCSAPGEAVVQGAGERPTIRADSSPLRPVHRAMPNVLGRDPAMVQLGDWIERVAPTDSTILILGESGTGKELIAEALHRASPRRSRELVRVNAAALPESLVESELFGHERGAFTGAVGRRRGKFEAAHRGTLFLDEIGDISPTTQVRLLRVLQSREFERVGGNETIRVDVRIICATHRNLQRLVEEGAFRLDLYHRIRGVSLSVPPLRERGDDVESLARYFLRREAAQLGRELTLSSAAVGALRRHSWPGNIRELQNAIRTAAVLTRGCVVQADALQLAAGSGETESRLHPGFSRDSATLPNLDEAKRELELGLISEALERTNGNISQAANLLGIKRPRLSQRIREFGISVPRRGAR